VLGHLPLVQHPPGLQADLAWVFQPPGRHLGGDLAQVLLGGGQQVLALAGAFGGH
jgi:hypothetical protein